jgi:hypothetical protein
MERKKRKRGENIQGKLWKPLGRKAFALNNPVEM